MNRVLRTKLVVVKVLALALIGAPLALSARGDATEPGVRLAWKAGGGAPHASMTLPAGAHPVLRATSRGAVQAVRLVIVRRADGARLFDGSLRSFRSLDLGRLSAALGDETLDVSLAGGGRAAAAVTLGWVSGS